MNSLSRSRTVFPQFWKANFSVMHRTDSAINIVYNLFKELRLSRDLFGDEMHFICQLSLQNNSALLKQGKIWTQKQTETEI